MWKCDKFSKTLICYAFSVFWGDVLGDVVDVVIRQSYLQKIEDSLKKNNILILKGLPGMGKTFLARIFMENNKKNYDAVYWMNWEKISFFEQLLSATKGLKKRKFLGSSEDLEIEFHNRVKLSGKKILLIIDNLNEMREVVDFLKKIDTLKNLTILITARENHFDFSSIEIGPFDSEESMQLVKKIYPDVEEKSSQRIVKLLANYPFYIPKVANIMKKSLVFNEKRVEEMLMMSTIDTLKHEMPASEIQKSLGDEAIKNHILSLKQTDLNIYKALVFLSLLSSKTIPIDLIHHFFSSQEEGDRVIRLLSDHTFVSSIDKEKDFVTFDIHQVMQMIVRSLASESDIKDIHNQCVIAFCEFYKKKFYSLISGEREDQVFFSHLSSVMSYFKSFEESFPFLILKIKRSLYSQRAPEEAKKIFLTIQKNISEDPAIDQKIFADFLCDCIFMKGFLYTKNISEFIKGIEDGDRAITLYKKLNDKNGVFHAYTRMGWVHLYRGELKECGDFLDKAFFVLSEVTEKYAQKEYYFTSGWYALCAGNWEKCIDECDKGIAIDVLSKNSYLGIYFYVHRAEALTRLGRYSEALESINDGLEKEEECFSLEGTLAKGDLLHTKAHILLCEGKLEDAEKEALESLAIFTKILGSFAYQETAVALHNLARIQEAKGELVSALGSYEKARDIFQKTSGAQGVYAFAETLSGLCRLSVLNHDEKKFFEVYSELKRRFGDNHPIVDGLQEWIVKSNNRHLLLV